MSVEGVNLPEPPGRLPLLHIALLALIAALLATHSGALPAWLAVAVGTCAGLVIAFISPWRGERRWLLSCCVLGCVFGVWMQVRERVEPSSALGHRMMLPAERHEIRALVMGEPAESRFGEGGEVPMRLLAVVEQGEMLPASGRMWVRFTGWPVPPMAYGDIVSINGVVSRADAPSYGLRRSRYQMVCTPEEITMTGEHQGRGPVAWSQSMRAAGARMLEKGVEDRPESTRVIKALLLGYRGELDEELNELFAKAGALHIFAVSGLHVGMIGVFLIGALKAGGVQRTRWGWAIIPLLLFFVMATGLKSSATRAWIMASLYWGAPLLRRRPDARTALAAAVVVILLYEPRQVTDLGFIFSFVTVGLMIGWLPIAGMLIRTWLRMPDWSEGEEKERGLRRRRMASDVLNFLAVSSTAWMASLPLTALYFNLYSPVGLLANVLVIPGAFVMVGLGLLTLLLGWIPGVALVLNTANAWVVGFLVKGIGVISDWPWAWQVVTTPPVVGVWIWYALSVGIALRARPDRISFAMLAAMFIGWAGYVAALNPDGRVVLWNKGGTPSLLFRNSANRGVLVDPGPAFGAGFLVRELRGMGIDRLDALVLTHADSRHFGAVERLLEEMPIDRVIIPSATFRSEGWELMRSLIEAAGIPWEMHAAGHRETWSGDWWVETLHPEPGTVARRAAQGSLVLRVSRTGDAFLISGGAGASEEEALLARGVDPGATLWIVPAGELDVGGDAWMQVVYPRGIVVALSSMAVTRRLQEEQAAKWAASGFHVRTLPPAERIDWQLPLPEERP